MLNAWICKVAQLSLFIRSVHTLLSDLNKISCLVTYDINNLTF